jgi:hypothetical protein
MVLGIHEVVWLSGGAGLVCDAVHRAGVSSFLPSLAALGVIFHFFLKLTLWVENAVVFSVISQRLALRHMP